MFGGIERIRIRVIHRRITFAIRIAYISDDKKHAARANRRALLVTADEPPAEKVVPGVSGFYKALKDEETWRVKASMPNNMHRGCKASSCLIVIPAKAGIQFK